MLRSVRQTTEMMAAGGNRFMWTSKQPAGLK